MLFKNIQFRLAFVCRNPWSGNGETSGTAWVSQEKSYIWAPKKCYSSPLKTTNHDRYSAGKKPFAEDNASRDTGEPLESFRFRGFWAEKWGAVREHIKKCLAVMTRSFRREEQSSLLRESSFEPSTVSLFARSDFSSYDEPRSEGYDEYFDPPLESKYECPICLLGLREPVQTSCGHRFCKGCILRSIR